MHGVPRQRISSSVWLQITLSTRLLYELLLLKTVYLSVYTSGCLFTVYCIPVCLHVCTIGMWYVDRPIISLFVGDVGGWISTSLFYLGFLC